jgi:hypothetical protein
VRRLLYPKRSFFKHLRETRWLDFFDSFSEEPEVSS